MFLSFWGDERRKNTNILHLSLQSKCAKVSSGIQRPDWYWENPKNSGTPSAWNVGAVCERHSFCEYIIFFFEFLLHLLINDQGMFNGVTDNLAKKPYIQHKSLLLWICCKCLAWCHWTCPLMFFFSFESRDLSQADKSI